MSLHLQELTQQYLQRHELTDSMVRLITELSILPVLPDDPFEWMAERCLELDSVARTYPVVTVPQLDFEAALEVGEMHGEKWSALCWLSGDPVKSSTQPLKSADIGLAPRSAAVLPTSLESTASGIAAPFPPEELSAPTPRTPYDQRVAPTPSALPASATLPAPAALASLSTTAVSDRGSTQASARPAQCFLPPQAPVPSGQASMLPDTQTQLQENDEERRSVEKQVEANPPAEPGSTARGWVIAVALVVVLVGAGAIARGTKWRRRL
jgi:hypothetical protein